MGSSNTLPISAVSLLRFPYTQFQKVSFEDGLLRSKCRLLWSGNLLHRGKEVLPKQRLLNKKNALAVLVVATRQAAAAQSSHDALRIISMIVHYTFHWF